MANFTARIASTLANLTTEAFWDEQGEGDLE